MKKKDLQEALMRIEQDDVEIVFKKSETINETTARLAATKLGGSDKAKQVIKWPRGDTVLTCVGACMYNSVGSTLLPPLDDSHNN